MAATATPATVAPIVNVVVRAVLRTPLLHRVLSRNTMLLTFTGRSSGRTYTVPVSYQRDRDTLTCYTRADRAWWKNLRGEPPSRSFWLVTPAAVPPTSSPRIPGAR